MSFFGSFKKFLPISMLLVAIFFLWIRNDSLIGEFYENRGYISLNQATATQEPGALKEYATAARSYFNVAQNLNDQNLSSVRGIGLSLGILQNNDEAITSLDKLGAHSAVNYSLLGDNAARLGLLNIAIFWHERAVDLDSNQPVTWLKLGELYELDNQPEKSLTAYKMAWNQVPSLGFKPYVSSLLARSELVLAESTLREILNRDLDFYDRLWGWHTLGRLLQNQERWDEAYNTYQSALQEYRQEPSLLVSLGMLAYEHQNDRHLAVQLFNEAIAVNEEDGAGYFAMGDLMAREKNYTAAEQWFQAALERNDTNVRWWFVRANTARQSENHDLAVEIYQDILIKFPGHMPAYFELAKTYRLLESPEEASQTLDQALTLFPDPPARYLLSAGEIYEWAGQLDLAVKSYKQLLDIDPDNDKARKGLNRLQ